MWFGRTVPLFQFPISQHSTGRQEERLLPLPSELCLGMASEDGTALYVTYGINPEQRKLKTEEPAEITWGEDLAGWFVISPFPPRLFQTERIGSLGVHIRNQPGSFLKTVTEPVADHEGIILAMEVLGTGDIGSLLLFPDCEGARRFQKTMEEMVSETSDAPSLIEALESREWRVAGSDPKRTERPGLPLWLDRLFKPSETQKPEDRIEWMPERRVLVRDRQITLPYGEFWYHFERKRKNASRGEVVPPPLMPSYCLLARDIEIPVLVVLVPSRPLFRIDLDFTAQERQGSPFSGNSVGVGIVKSVVEQLRSRWINIWHIQHLQPSLSFEAPADAPFDANGLRLRSLEGKLSIVASLPKSRAYDSPEAIGTYLAKLQRELVDLRRSPTDREGFFKSKECKNLLQRLKDVPDRIREKVEVEGFVDPEALKRIVDSHFREFLNVIIEPSFVRNVEIHGPPLFRCFLSHSATPDYEERDHVDRLKALLKSEVYEVVEGQFAMGQSTEELSRGRIRHCDVLISFLWPREDFRIQAGGYLAPEWIAHEESFAIGHGILVLRVREEAVGVPRYERDRPDFTFKRGDVSSWQNLENKLRLELRQLALALVMGVPPRARRQEK